MSFLGTMLLLSACGDQEGSKNLIIEQSEEERNVSFFSPMEKTEVDSVNVARSAADKTVIMAEEKLGVTVHYVTYTAEDYQDKTWTEHVTIWMTFIC